MQNKDGQLTTLGNLIWMLMLVALPIAIFLVFYLQV